jgi:serine protease Do
MKSSITLVMCSLLLGSSVSAQESNPTRALGAVDTALAAAAERAARSVVSLEVERTSYGSRPLSALEKRGLGVTGVYDPRYFTRPEAPCSGVVLAKDVVATSSWNVAGDGEITVTDSDGGRHSAQRLGHDDNLMITLLRVDDATLTPFEAATGPVRVGRTLLLVGRTESNRPSVTRGIVSGLARLRGDAFTHSARTSYGNVGGALVDLEGKLLGVAVRHSNRARQGQSSGVAFGARLDRIQPNFAALSAGDSIPSRPTAFLGIGPDPRFPGPGVKIARIVADTAALRVGLKAGDVIKIFNSVELMDFSHLVEEIQKLEIGAEILITVSRGDAEKDFQVKLGKRPPNPR